MSYAGHAFEKHFVLNPAAGILSSGNVTNLANGQIGFFTKDGKRALSLAELTQYKQEVRIAQGTYHFKDQVYEYFGGLKKPDTTKPFKGQFVSKLIQHKPVHGQQKKVAIGYDGVVCCGPVAFECDKVYTLRLELKNSPVHRFMHHEYHRDYIVKTPCCDPCAEGCVAGTVDARSVFDNWVKQINNDPYANKFVKAATKLQNYSSTPGAVAFVKYELKVTDEGGPMDLAAVQAQYPTLKIQRDGRSGLVTTYSVIKSAGLPTAYTPVGGIGSPVCLTCPAGWTTVAKSDVYWITRPLSASDDLNSVSDQNTFATAVAGNYTGETAVKFISHNSAYATIELRFPAGTVVPAFNADIVTKVKTEDLYCVPPAGSSVAWVAAGNFYKVPRTLCITLPKDCSGNNRLTDLQAAYAGDPQISVAPAIYEYGETPAPASTNCGDAFVISQLNNAYLQDDCFEPATPEWDSLAPFEGIQWETCKCGDEAAIGTACVGLVIKGIYDYKDEQFSNCSWEMMDKVDTELVDFTVHLFDNTGKTCDRLTLPVNVLQEGIRDQGIGYNVVKEYVGYVKAYKLGLSSEDRRLNEIWQAVERDVVKREKFYKLYNLVHTIPMHSSSRLNFEPEVYSYYFWVEESANTQEFEQYLEALASNSGTSLEVF